MHCSVVYVGVGGVRVGGGRIHGVEGGVAGVTRRVGRVVGGGHHGGLVLRGSEGRRGILGRVVSGGIG